MKSMNDYSLGLKRGTVELLDHDKNWESIAQNTMIILKKILKEEIIAIEHIGSTAISTIKAKPIIDLVVGVNDLSKIIQFNKQLEQANIIYRGYEHENQLLYVMGDLKKDTRTHHIHVVKYQSIEWENYLYFRDTLNQNKDIALEYQQIKENLSKQYHNDRIAYTLGKQPFIDQILKNKKI